MKVIEEIKKQILKGLYLTKGIIRYFRCLSIKPPTDFKQIPIIINNFNQYDYLLILLKGLEDRGYRNIYIIDNASTYPPLLEFYKNTKYTVFKLSKNYGYLSLWDSKLYKLFENQYFVYTDPDLEISDECPDNFMKYFYEILKKHPLSGKIGFSLKISDLPEHFNKRSEVIEWEKQYWQRTYDKNIYKADIDTTFALHRPFTKPGSNIYDHNIRIGFPYTMKHLPWYVDSNNLSENIKYYIKSCSKKTHWSNQIDDNIENISL